jgi:hypothetical protein
MNDEQAMFIMAVILSINLVMTVLGIIPLGTQNTNFNLIEQTDNEIYQENTNITLKNSEDYNPNTVDETSTDDTSENKFGLSAFVNILTTIKNMITNITFGYTKFFKIIKLPKMLVVGFSSIIMFLQALALFAIAKTAVGTLRGVKL